MGCWPRDARGGIGLWGPAGHRGRCVVCVGGDGHGTRWYGELGVNFPAVSPAGGYFLRLESGGGEGAGMCTYAARKFVRVLQHVPAALAAGR